MSTDNIEKLYKHFGILADAKDKISEHEKEYLGILTAVKGSAKEKRLASQFIARFFKHFPKLADQAIEAQLDLCEDEDVAIRKQAIKDLPCLCKDNKEHTQKISDILAQLLQAEDNSELSIVHTALVTLFKVDAKGSLAGIFSQILSGDDLVRERCFKFLSSKVKSLGHEFIPKEAEDFLIEQSKKVLQDVTAEEFHRLMDLLGWTRLGQTIAGQQELVDLVAEQADIGQDFDPKDAENDNVDRLIQCFKHSLPFFSSQVNSGRFVAYICEQVLPRLDEIRPREETDLTLEVLRLFAELATHAGTLETAPACVENVFNRLLAYMPLPPETDGPEEPRLEFSHVECLIYSLHQLGRQSPEVLTRDPDTLKDFRFRLQYFARGIQGYIKKLREALQGKSAEELKSDENRIKVVALKTTSNINTLIKDLFHSPPSYKSSVSLSWKPTTGTAKVADTLSPGQKRHTPITFSNETSPNKASRMDKSQRELYQPPSGKYSNKVSSYVPSQMRGRGGGRWRGRGGGFRGNNRGWRRNY